MWIHCSNWLRNSIFFQFCDHFISVFFIPCRGTSRKVHNLPRHIRIRWLQVVREMRSWAFGVFTCVVSSTNRVHFERADGTLAVDTPPRRGHVSRASLVTPQKGEEGVGMYEYTSEGQIFVVSTRSKRNKLFFRQCFLRFTRCTHLCIAPNLD